MNITQRELQIRHDLMYDFEHYARTCLKIRAKDGSVENFVLNRAQKYILTKLDEQRSRTGKVRAIILKGRQQGCSTLIGARFYHRVTHYKGLRCFILTHELEATHNLFDMAKRFHEHVPEIVKAETGTSNSKELIFSSLDSGYKIGTADNKNVGRSSTVQLFHGSEVAFWTNASEHAKGIFQAVPDMPNTEIILESTANGVGSFYHQQWQMAEAGKSDFIAIFVPWYWQEEYVRDVPEDFQLNHVEYDLQATYGLSLQQLSWRRNKIKGLSVNGQDGEKSFKQEYPMVAAEAFQLTGENAYIDSPLVMRARRCEAERFGYKVMGVDPARFGDDSTSIIFRQGRVAYGLRSYQKKDTMEVVGIVHQLIQEERPDKVAIDVGGLGAGVVDRLFELGHRDRVVPVNAGSKPLNENLYYNKRAEMWGETLKWLIDIPVQIPDDDGLHGDLCGIRYSFDSNSRLVMEKKEDMKKRGIRSPDKADSLCLTFSIPHSAFKQFDKPADSIVDALAMDFNSKMSAIGRSRR